MRFPLCVAFLAVCILVLQCTVNATGVQEGDELRSDGSDNAVVATKTTTAAQKVTETDKITEDSEKGRTTGGDLQTGHEAEANARAAEEAHAAADPAPKTITTSNADNVDPQNVVGQVNGEENSDKPALDLKLKDGAADKSGHADASRAVIKGQREAAPAPAEEEAAPQTTSTTTASVKSLQVPNNSQTKVQTPPTTTVIQTNSLPLSPPVREVAEGGIESGKKNVGEEEKTTGDQRVSEQRGADASVPVVKDSAVTPSTSIAKKNNEDNAGVQPNKNSGDKKTHQNQSPHSPPNITEEKKASTKTSTTSSAEPTNETSPGITSNLPKGFKIPQSVDKTDGNRSVYLLFAFATLVTLAVTAVAPVHQVLESVLNMEKNGL